MGLKSRVIYASVLMCRQRFRVLFANRTLPAPSRILSQIIRVPPPSHTFSCRTVCFFLLFHCFFAIRTLPAPSRILSQSTRVAPPSQTFSCRTVCFFLLFHCFFC